MRRHAQGRREAVGCMSWSSQWKHCGQQPHCTNQNMVISDLHTYAEAGNLGSSVFPEGREEKQEGSNISIIESVAQGGPFILVATRAQVSILSGISRIHTQGQHA